MYCTISVENCEQCPHIIIQELLNFPLKVPKLLDHLNLWNSHRRGFSQLASPHFLVIWLFCMIWCNSPNVVKNQSKSKKHQIKVYFIMTKWVWDFFLAFFNFWHNLHMFLDTMEPRTENKNSSLEIISDMWINCLICPQNANEKKKYL